MQNLSKAAYREIIRDFAKAIKERRVLGPKPQKVVIDFRNDRKIGKERDVYDVPLELLRYRKENGRISSEVLSYEKHNGIMNETTVVTQNLLRKFLEEKDEEKTHELKATIIQDGQREPAIITADGFLINGNRRKMVLEGLFDETKKDEYSRMKVVILPDVGEEGGPPTFLEIEQIENRYQLQSDGKAEYSSFDKALSMKRKMDLQMSLEEQLRDDPVYSTLSEKDFRNAVAKIKDDYLGPLDCIDRYLAVLDREGLYETVSAGMSDKQGRWQAFLDYYKSVYKALTNTQKRIDLNIEEDEVGKIEDAAFKLIRKRSLSEISTVIQGVKLHQIMRTFPKLIKSSDTKKELLKLNDIDWNLRDEEKHDKEGKLLDEKDQDEVWGEINKAEIYKHVVKALRVQEYKEVQDTPVNLLEAALAKLNHKDMDPGSISIGDLNKALKLTHEIQHRARQLEHIFYEAIKNIDELRGRQPKKHRD